VHATTRHRQFHFPPTLSFNCSEHIGQKKLPLPKACKVPYLTKQAKVKRLRWARKYSNYGVEDWRRVIWSDECYIHLSDDRGTVWVTRQPNEEFQEDCLVPQFKQSPIRIMVWGCITEGMKGPLFALEYPGGKGGGMNAKRYREQVLEGGFYEWYMERCEALGLVAFQEDGAASYRAKSTKLWLKKHLVDTFPHPPSSPDLSPIEPLWNDLKNYIRARPYPPTTFAELKTAVFEAWDSITEEDINKHVRHMSDRVQAVIAAKGGHTRY
jgi:hypothetical protein